MKTICIISNSSLGALFKYLKIFKKKNLNFLIISAKKIKKKKLVNIKYFYLSNKNNDYFNKEAYKILKNYKPSKIILFYTKKINRLIYQNFKTINIHNSFLPHHKGLNVIKRIYKDDVKFFISSCHYINEKFDDGRIIYQIASPVKKYSLKFFNKISFLHRVVLLYAIINSNSKYYCSFINKENLISPGLNQKKINFKFWK